MRKFKSKSQGQEMNLIYERKKTESHDLAVQLEKAGWPDEFYEKDITFPPGKWKEKGKFKNIAIFLGYERAPDTWGNRNKWKVDDVWTNKFVKVGPALTEKHFCKKATEIQAHWLKEQIEKLGNPFSIMSCEIEYPDEETKMRVRSVLNVLLSELGYEPVKNPTTKDGRWKNKGKNTTKYSRSAA